MRLAPYLVGVAVICGFGCGKLNPFLDGPSEGPTLVNGVAVARTGNTRVPIVLAHEDGTQVAILADQAGSQMTGAVFIQQDGRKFVVTLGEDGLPALAYSGQRILLFRNFGVSTVDIAVIGTDGTTEIYRRVPVDRGQLMELAELARSPSPKTTLAKGWTSDLWLPAKMGLLMLSVAGCAAAIILTEGLALPCGQAILGVALNLAPGIEHTLGRTASTVSVVAGGVLCAGGEAEGCIDTIVEIASVATQAMDTTVQAKEDAIRAAETILVERSGPTSPVGQANGDGVEDYEMVAVDTSPFPTLRPGNAAVRLQFGNRLVPTIHLSVMVAAVVDSALTIMFEGDGLQVDYLQLGLPYGNSATLHQPLGCYVGLLTGPQLGGYSAGLFWIGGSGGSDTGGRQGNTGVSDSSPLSAYVTFTELVRPGRGAKGRASGYFVATLLSYQPGPPFKLVRISDGRFYRVPFD